MDWLLGRVFTVGETYEVYAPLAKELGECIGITFNDTKGYSFKLTRIIGGMLWTTDITYTDPKDGSKALPSEPLDGSYPIPALAVRYIRPVTND